MKRGMRFAYPLASFSLKKSLTKRRLCEAYEKPQWKGLLNCKRGRPMEGRPRASTLSFSLLLVCSPILNGMVIFMKFNILESVKTPICPFCGHKVDVSSFRDDLSVKEFHISGLCQRCQDEVFGNGPCANCNEEDCYNCTSP